ncbi:MAG: DEAD/DEAH box helicase [Terrimicrobiaceae bacterium]|nr:DEAD/DEAH box helicase [Terrimicrobiaceae bacterium]
MEAGRRLVYEGIIMSFQNLGLSEAVVHGAQRMGYVDPTPIQLRSFPAVLAGRDVVASAQTGTGKTAAFALPLLTLLGGRSGRLRCLVLEPTRELAMQVETAFRDFARFMDIGIALVHGGVGFGAQREALRAGCDIVVATPGRLLDHMGRGDARLGTVEHLVLDEADQMLDMGFLPDVRRIVEACPKKRQTLLYSATIPEEIERLAAWCLKDPEKIEVGARRSPAETVQHAIYPVASDQKFELLKALLDRTDYDSVLVFARTKDGADRIARQLKAEKHSVAVLHSNRTQTERVEALEGFKNGRYEVMVATDIAARGIDVAGVSHVINYDVPQHPEDYVHRIGRTGRAQSVGDAFTIMVAEDLPHVRAIERFIGQRVPRLKLDGFPYVYSAVFDEALAEEALKGAKGVRGMRGTTFGRRRRR